jgi:glycosyltransferase involved in cell wall biosynthesis
VPLISVVIPTLDRPKLLLRAIGSVLRQTHREMEVIVVADRPDPETIDAVRSMEDPRLRLILNPHPSTAAGARNFGADQATGEWIAFLDDDDEWLPNKLERQLAFVAGRAPALLTCLSRILTPTATYVAPQVMYDNSGPIDEYLFDRRSLFTRPGFIQTSSFLLPRCLFDKVRFNVESAHDDWEFLLRLSKETGARIETVPEVLAVIYFDQRGSTNTIRTWSWARSVDWIDSMRPIISRHAYSGFCLSVAASRAVEEGTYAAIPELLGRAFRNGSPRLWHILPFLGYWITPLAWQQRLRDSFRGDPALPRVQRPLNEP